MTAAPGVFAADLSRQSAQRQLARIFAAAGLENADLDARLILCAALRIDHLDLLRDPDHRLGTAAAILTDFCSRRLNREPVSRILGRREFWGLEFAVDAAVLDPRPDTETLIEAIQELMRERAAEPLRLLDLGTGSGAILAALLSIFPQATGFAVDISAQAAAIAKANLAKLGFGDRSFVVCGRWTDALSGEFDLVVSNPPYIVSDDIAQLAPEVRRYDPLIALDGGADGLAAYRRLAPAAAALLTPSGHVAFECGAGQAKAVAALVDAAGFADLKIRADLAGHERVVTARKPG